VVASSLGTLDSSDALRQLAIDVRDRLGSISAVIALGADIDGKAAVIVATTPEARTAGFSAGALAKRAAGVLGGGGGGRDDIAQSGGTDTTLIPAALDDLRSKIGR
jgi:alanyl-tRNA synthetase